MQDHLSSLIERMTCCTPALVCRMRSLSSPFADGTCTRGYSLSCPFSSIDNVTPELFDTVQRIPAHEVSGGKMSLFTMDTFCSIDSRIARKRYQLPARKALLTELVRVLDGLHKKIPRGPSTGEFIPPAMPFRVQGSLGAWIHEYDEKIQKAFADVDKPQEEEKEEEEVEKEEEVKEDEVEVE